MVTAHVLLQEVLLLSPSAVSKLKVPDAHPAEWNERASGAEESATPRLLQHSQGELSSTPPLLSPSVVVVVVVQWSC